MKIMGKQKLVGVTLAYMAAVAGVHAQSIPTQLVTPEISRRAAATLSSSFPTMPLL